MLRHEWAAVVSRIQAQAYPRARSLYRAEHWVKIDSAGLWLGRLGRLRRLRGMSEP